MVTLDVSHISEIDKHNLSNTILSAIYAFYDNPTNVKHFERWKTNKLKEAKTR